MDLAVTPGKEAFRTPKFRVGAERDELVADQKSRSEWRLLVINGMTTAREYYLAGIYYKRKYVIKDFEMWRRGGIFIEI